MLIAVAIVMFLIIVASTWWFGLWANLITLISLLIAAMVASSAYVQVWTQLSNNYPGNRNSYEFISIWILFVITFIVLRVATDSLSGFVMKFDLVTEMIGRSVLSIWIACVFICFSFFTLQTAPLPPVVFGEGRLNLFEREKLGTFPDRLWLGFIQSRSRGALSSSKAKGLFPEYRLTPHPDDVNLDARVFDPYARFLLKRSRRRRNIAFDYQDAFEIRLEEARANN